MAIYCLLFLTIFLIVNKAKYLLTIYESDGWLSIHISCTSNSDVCRGNVSGKKTLLFSEMIIQKHVD